MPEKTIEGSCLCGAVTFAVTPPFRFVAHCHCSMCRRAHGAPMVTWAGVARERLHLPAAAEEHLAHHASSAGARRSFCATCGSSLFFQSERWPGDVHIAAANLADLDGMSPQAHVFYSDRAEWFEPHDDLPRFGGSSGVEPLSEN